ncbi:DUF2938 family protein [Pseudophaeobacter sp. EL27]|uniref:DUF2938 family protein n=1 Tax=Pseudophaeobacter sp. EL27 TaxID=2107580 RepID=UPI000EFBE9BE|nr:DUF2938 family protein [Pseudophaeobacter sp. EL27]
MEFDWFIIQLAALAGVIATVVIDLLGWIRRRWFGISGPDWGLVGRWLWRLPQGDLVLEPQDRVRPAMLWEQSLGWVFHYGVGIVLAQGLTGIVGSSWLTSPEPVVPILFGLSTVVLPLCLMQPAMGAGFAARKAPNPALMRLNSLITHGVFGVGLYGASLGVQLL